MCCFQLLILKWKNADYIYDSRSCHHRQEVASQTVRYSPQSNLNKASQMISTKITAAVLEKKCRLHADYIHRFFYAFSA